MYRVGQIWSFEGLNLPVESGDAEHGIAPRE